jgi:hypothetical protein
VACLIVSLPAAAQRTGTDASPPAQTDQKEAKPDPGVQIITNVLKLIEEKARADAKRKADAERAKQDAAAAQTQTPTEAPKTAPVETPKAVPVETRTPAVEPRTPVARKVPLRPFKPQRPRPDLVPKPLPKSLRDPVPIPKPDLPPPAIEPPSQIVLPPPVVEPHPAPVSPPVERAPESNGLVRFLLDLLLVVVAIAATFAVRRWFFAAPPPLPAAKAFADPGTVSAPQFADNPPPPQVSFLVASGAFTSKAEYPQGAA